jgi:hypothetical protein
VRRFSRRRKQRREMEDFVKEARRRQLQEQNIDILNFSL